MNFIKRGRKNEGTHLTYLEREDTCDLSSFKSVFYLLFIWHKNI